MKTRRVGATDLLVSQIGFGCGGNAGLMVRGTASEQERVVAQALESGITYFDNAPDYGDGAAEENLGRALKALGGRPVITTKVEIRSENLDDIEGHIVRSVEASLRRLGIEAVEVVQIHNGPVAERPSLQGRSYKTLWIEDYLKPNGVLQGIDRILRDGKTRFAGFVSRGGDEDEARQLLATGLFHLVNVPFTLLNPTAGYSKPKDLAFDPDYENIIGLAQAAGAGVAVFSPLAGGILTDAVADGLATHPLARPRDAQGQKAKEALRMARVFQSLAASRGLSLVQLAYGFILSHPGVSTVVGGISSIEQVRQVVAASTDEPLHEDLFAEIQRAWRA